MELLSIDKISKKLNQAAYKPLNDLANQSKTRYRDLYKMQHQMYPIIDDILNEIRAYLQNDIVSMTVSYIEPLQKDKINLGIAAYSADFQQFIPLIMEVVRAVRERCNFIFFVFGIAEEALDYCYHNNLPTYIKSSDLSALREPGDRELSFEEVDDIRMMIEMVEADVGLQFFHNLCRSRYLKRLAMVYDEAVEATGFKDVLTKYPAEPILVKKDGGKTDSKSDAKSTDEATIVPDSNTTSVSNSDSSTIPDKGRDYVAEWKEFLANMEEIVGPNF